ncbi:unnamed protein product [Kuraishia capsulata CBS 1993]|uniref:Uncharacterized protein n=1 Tax=Kuraishia capsulata CBS 1993 TaxID=1382522 RepID=W6MLK4_9ASCO|nr:uncharacterized protein KUCA_T00001687001 [Kuraishia capsulata CBS 1993]CDK25717.1 unnamed protein product [Kuraishia capsulata CBS 1993]
MVAISKLAPSRIANRAGRRLAYLCRLLTNEEFYNHLNGPLADPVALDSTLSTICYFFLFIAEVIRMRPTLIKHLKIVLRKLLALVLTSLKRSAFGSLKNHVEPTLLSWSSRLDNKEAKEPEAIEPQVNALDITSSKLRSISNYISDIRIFVRLWGIPALTAFGISEIKQTRKSGQSRVSRWLNYIDVVSIVAYQPLENVGFLADHKWTHHPDSVAGEVGLWYYVVSSRLWAIYVVLEVVKLAKEYVISIRNGSRIPLLENSAFSRGLVSNLANLPLTVHWSLPEGCLPDIVVGFLGTFSSALNTRESWSAVFRDIRALDV